MVGASNDGAWIMRDSTALWLVAIALSAASCREPARDGDGGPRPADCGDGELGEGEVCDGDDLGGATCESLGLGSGALACASDCSAFDAAGCELACSPACEGLECGPDPRCGEPCGTCDDGAECIDGACVTGPPCPEGRRRCGEECVDTASDARHCGACDATCPSGALCVGSECQHPIDCREEPCSGFTYCDLSDGTCRPGCIADDQCLAEEHCDRAAHECRCDEPFNRCAGVCVEITDPLACGPGCALCPDDPHGNPTCDGERCGISCDASYHLCDRVCASDADPASCGSRCEPCPGVANGAATCVAGRCSFECDDGFHACGAACVTDTDVAHCGARCDPCVPPPHGTATCDGASCGFTCVSGYHRCGTACSSDHDVATCGAACTPCVAPSHAVATCDGVECGYDCQAGYRDCAGACARCPTGASATACSGAACVASSCSAGYRLCGGTCAACPAGASATTCDSASCVATACSAGFRACGGTCAACPPGASATTCDGASCVAMACEAGSHLCGTACVSDDDPAHCGDRCTPCPADAHGTETCDGTSCGVECDRGFTLCSGGCTLIGFDEANCGACGASCAAGDRCAGGACAAPCPVHGFAPSFTGLETIVSPSAMVAADLNADGFLDVAIVDDAGMTVADVIFIYFGDGTTVAATPATYAAPEGSLGLAVGRLDRDADLDLAAASVDENAVVVFRNNGAGGFLRYDFYPVDGYAYSVDIADFDNDGANDLVVGYDGWDGFVQVLLADRMGGFTPQAPVALADASVTELVAHDFSGDGHVDVVVSQYGDLQLLLGAGDGSLALGDLYEGSLGSGSYQLGDFDEDGFEDLVSFNDVSSIHPCEEGVDVFVTLLAGGFDRHTCNTVGAFTRAGALADFDGDGHLDAVACSRVAEDLLVLRGDGTGDLPVRGAVYTVDALQIVAADFDGDRTPDIALTNADADRMEVWLSTCE